MTIAGLYGSDTPRGRPAFDPADPGLQAINPPDLFNGATLFSQVIVAPAGRTVWISGLIGVTADNRLVEGGKPAQIAQTFRNIATAIAAAGCRPEHCVQLREYLVDYSERDLPVLQQEIAALFVAGALPTNVIVPVPRLGRDGALVEIELVCALPGPG